MDTSFHSKKARSKNAKRRGQIQQALLKKQKQDEVNHKVEKAKEKFDPLRVIEHYIGKSKPVKKEEYLVSKFVPAGDLRFPSTSMSSTSAQIGTVEVNAKQSKEKKKKHKKEKKSKKSKIDKQK